MRVSADGRYIALSFQSIEPSDGTLFCEEDVIDTVENFTEREVDGDEFACATPAISDDGRFHTFLEIENYQGDINQYYYELFVADEASPNITWTLLSATPAGGRARGDSGGAVITPDGKHIIFYSAALDIVAQPAGGPLPSTNVYENPPFAH